MKSPASTAGFLFGEDGGCRLLAQPVHPAELIVELLSTDRIAVRQIDGGDDHLVNFRFDIAAVAVIGASRQPHLTELGLIAPGQDGNAVEPFWPCHTAL